MSKAKRNREKRERERERERVRSEWHGRSDFSQFAEALDVPTTAIMAVHQPHGESVFVLYSPDVENEPTKIFKTTLRRGVDGVLFVARQPIELPGLWDEIVRRIESEGFGAL